MAKAIINDCAHVTEAVDFLPCTRTQTFADFNLANFAPRLEPAPVQDPIDTGA